MFALHRGQHTLVILGHDLDELRNHRFPLAEQSTGADAAGGILMLLHQRLHGGNFLGVVELFDAHHLLVDALGKIARLVQHVGDTARHARAEVASGTAQHHHATAGHVFATVVADRLDDGIHAAVAHRKAFAGHAADEHLSAGGAVSRYIADEDVV